MSSFIEQLFAFPPVPARTAAAPRDHASRQRLSAETIDRFRQVMDGKGWFTRRELEPILGMTRQQLNHAFSKCLVPQGFVTPEQLAPLKWRYHWKEGQ